LREVVWFDEEEKRLDHFGDFRPQIRLGELARPKPVQYEARDGTPIRAYLTLLRGRDASGLPMILMPHGGPYLVRDSLTYDDEVQLLVNRDYAVLQPSY
jgi:dipeptidyl aminopeptidase/acylaminoacyl peptidase